MKNYAPEVGSKLRRWRRNGIDLYVSATADFISTEVSKRDIALDMFSPHSLSVEFGKKTHHHFHPDEPRSFSVPLTVIEPRRAQPGQPPRLRPRPRARRTQVAATTPSKAVADVQSPKASPATTVAATASSSLPKVATGIRATTPDSPMPIRVPKVNARRGLSNT